MTIGDGYRFVWLAKKTSERSREKIIKKRFFFSNL